MNDEDVPALATAPILLLLKALRPDRKTTVVDVGANPINEAPYAGLLALRGCHVVGFEPQTDAYEALLKTKTEDETYYPFAVGTGETLDLHIYKSSGMTSIFSPYKPTIQLIGKKVLGRVLEKISFDTVALDSVSDLPEFDLMKIDIQGGETLVFQGAEQAMSQCIAVIVELRYLRLYQGEPMLGGVDNELRRQGFYLHKFMFNKSFMLKSSQSGRLNSSLATDQLLDGDAIYLRNIAEPERLSVEQLKHMAIMAASVFDSHSLVLFCLDALVARGAAPADLPAAYVDALPQHLRRD